MGRVLELSAMSPEAEPLGALMRSGSTIIGKREQSYENPSEVDHSESMDLDTEPGTACQPIEVDTEMDLDSCPRPRLTREDIQARLRQLETTKARIEQEQHELQRMLENGQTLDNLIGSAAEANQKESNNALRQSPAIGPNLARPLTPQTLDGCRRADRPIERYIRQPEYDDPVRFLHHIGAARNEDDQPSGPGSYQFGSGRRPASPPQTPDNLKDAGSGNVHSEDREMQKPSPFGSPNPRRTAGLGDGGKPFQASQMHSFSLEPPPTRSLPLSPNQCTSSSGIRNPTQPEVSLPRRQPPKTSQGATKEGGTPSKPFPCVFENCQTSFSKLSLLR